MTRLPTPGSDDGAWGDILNDFLSVEHNTDGTLKKAGAIQAAQTAADNAQSTADAAQSALSGKADTSAIVPVSTINAKGDLLVGTGNDAVSRIGVGSNGTVLMADSSQATGVKWGAASGGGSPLTWTPLILATGVPWFSGSYDVQAYGAPYATPAAAISVEGVVYLQGLLKFAMTGISQIGGNALLATLPLSSMYPVTKKLVWSFDANLPTTGFGIAINTDGTIVTTSTLGANQLPNLDSINFGTQA